MSGFETEIGMIRSCIMHGRIPVRILSGKQKD